MKRLSAMAAALLAATLAAPAWALPVSPENKALLEQSPQYQGLLARYAISGVEEADLDADGLRELVVAFRPKQKERLRGGFVALGSRGGKLRTVWAGLYEGGYPENVSASAGVIDADVWTTRGRAHVTLSHGQDFWLVTDKQSPFADVKVTVSSNARGQSAEKVGPKFLTDGDPDTSWVDGSPGTGAGEWIQLEFKKPVNVGLLGVIGGDHRSPQKWRDSNRLRRFTVTVETEDDRSTVVEDMDLTAMLHLPSTGRKIELTAKDKPRTRWVHVRTKGAVTLKLSVDSVFLGEVNDDLFVGEIELGEFLPDPKVNGAVAAPVSKPVEKQAADAPAEPRKVTIPTPGTGGPVRHRAADDLANELQ